ncbi:MAG: hypothetical protein EA393_08760 [Bacteroidetes bacterium]|nr:MAG: hypothetical protein EA393_08760 [Bacteroidota bacterium]
MFFMIENQEFDYIFSRNRLRHRLRKSYRYVLKTIIISNCLNILNLNMNKKEFLSFFLTTLSFITLKPA